MTEFCYTSMYGGLFVRYTRILDLLDDLVSAIISKKKKIPTDRPDPPQPRYANHRTFFFWPKEGMVGTSSLTFKLMDANLMFNRGSFSSIASGLPLGDNLSKTGM